MSGFSLDRGGHGQEARIVHAAGHPLLDEEALATLLRAQPLPAVPDDFSTPRSVTMPVSFRLKG